MENRQVDNSIPVLSWLGMCLVLLISVSLPIQAQTSGTAGPALNDNVSCDSRSVLLDEAYKLRSKLVTASQRKSIITPQVADFFDDLIDDLRTDSQNLKSSFFADFLVQRLGPLDIQISSKIRNNFYYGGAAKTKSDFLAERLYGIVEQISEIACEGKTLKCSDVAIRFTFDGTGFLAETRFNFPQRSSTNAAVFTRAYNLENNYEGCSQADESKLVFDSTRSFAENDQVFIVTRIPRESVDSLFAKVAK